MPINPIDPLGLGDFGLLSPTAGSNLGRSPDQKLSTNAQEAASIANNLDLQKKMQELVARPENQGKLQQLKDLNVVAQVQADEQKSKLKSAIQALIASGQGKALAGIDPNLLRAIAGDAETESTPDMLRRQYQQDVQRSTAPIPGKPRPVAEAISLGLGAVIGGIIGGGEGMLIGAESAGRGAEEATAEKYKLVLSQYQQNIEAAQDRLSKRDQIAGSFRNLMAVRPEVLAGMDPDLLQALSQPDMSFVQGIDLSQAGTRKDEATELKYRLQDLDDRLRLSGNPEEVARLLNLRADMLYPKGSEERKRLGDATVKQMAENKLPPFGTIVKEYGVAGVDVYSRAQQTGDVQGFWRELSSLQIQPKSAGVPPSQQARFDMAAKVANRKAQIEQELGHTVSDAEAIAALDTNDRPVAQKMFPAKKDAERQLNIQRIWNQAWNMIPKETRDTNPGIAKIQADQLAKELLQKFQEAAPSQSDSSQSQSAQSTRQDRINRAATVMLKNGDPRLDTKAAELEDKHLTDALFEKALLAEAVRLAEQDLKNKVKK